MQPLVPIAVLCASLLSACASIPLLRAPIAPPLPPAAPQVAVYDCEGELITVRMDEAALALWPAGTPRSDPLQLAADPAASGARYVGDGLQFWSKGDRALYRQNEVERRCRLRHEQRPWREAWLRGVDARAVGQEPPWLIEITEGGELLLITDYGARQERWPTPPAVPTAQGWRREAEGLRLDWEDRPCEDLMSGQAHGAQVRVHREGLTLHGCGERL
jgi:membrane-bound inhibitor of C-type lysozyme